MSHHEPSRHEHSHLDARTFRELSHHEKDPSRHDHSHLDARTSREMSHHEKEASNHDHSHTEKTHHEKEPSRHSHSHLDARTSREVPHHEARTSREISHHEKEPSHLDARTSREMPHHEREASNHEHSHTEKTHHEKEPSRHSHLDARTSREMHHHEKEASSHQHHADVDGMDELRSRFQHLQRVTRGESGVRMRHHEGPMSSPLGGSGLDKSYSKTQLQRLEKCFLMADHDHDGKLNSIELSYWLEKHHCPVSHPKLVHLLHIADHDGDGALSFAEFVQFCQKIELDEHHLEEETFFDCLEHQNDHRSNDDVSPTPYHTHSTKHPDRPSLHTLKEHHLASNAHHAFEAQIRKCADGECGLERDPAEFQHRVEEIRKTAVGFDFAELKGILRHPREEMKGGVCKNEGSHHQKEPSRHEHSHHDARTSRELSHHEKQPSHQNHHQEAETFRTELHITPHGHEGHSHHHEEDDAKVIVPRHPGSMDKFDKDNGDDDVDLERGGSGYDQGKEEKKKKMDPYEKFYGTHPGGKLEEDVGGLQLAEAGWDPDMSHWT